MEKVNENRGQLLDRLERYLARPILISETQVFGDINDDLAPRFVEYQIKQKGKHFRQYLMEVIANKGNKKSTEIYGPARVSKSVYSKTTNFDLDPPHIPQKGAIAGLCISLRLNIDEAEEFYNAAGYALTKSDFVDRVVRFFILEGIYDVDEINFCIDYFNEERERQGKRLYKLLGEKAREDKDETEKEDETD